MKRFEIGINITMFPFSAVSRGPFQSYLILEGFDLSVLFSFPVCNSVETGNLPR